MPSSEPFLEHLLSLGGKAAPDDPGVIESFGDVRTEYAAPGDGGALVYRSDRALLELSGNDRASWLHNLVTNQIKALSPGDGVYAFALNVQGRILFDLNVLVMRDAMWLDIDRRFLGLAMKHFEKYQITEDVRIADRSAEFVRMALVGENSKVAVGEFGASHAANVPILGNSTMQWRGEPISFIRNDFCGPFAIELFIPTGHATACWEYLSAGARQGKAIPAGSAAVQIHRIEAGIPWPGREISDEYLPAETGQLGRAVSFNKGCYLGQEIVERMRSRGVVARKLCGLRISGDAVPSAGTSVSDESGKGIGAITSFCQSIALDQSIALAYLKSAAANPGAAIQLDCNGATVRAEVAALPFVGSASH